MVAAALLRYTTMALVLATGIIAAWRYRHMLRSSGRWLAGWGMFSAGWEMVAFASSFAGGSNTSLFSLYTVSETVFITMALTGMSYMRPWRTALYVAAGALCLATCVEWYLLPAGQIVTFSRLAQSIGLLAMAVITLHSLTRSPFRLYLAYQAEFWLCTSCLIYFTMHLVVALGYNYMLHDAYMRQLWVFNDLASIGASFFTVFGLYVSTRLQRDLAA